MELIKSDNSVYKVPNTIILKVQDNGTYTIGDVPVGNYKTIRFDIGLDAATNQKTPSSVKEDPMNSASMWFGAAAQPDGYVFVNAQGKIDTTANGNGTVAQMQPFIYKIGTSTNLVKKNNA